MKYFYRSQFKCDHCGDTANIKIDETKSLVDQKPPGWISLSDTNSMMKNVMGNVTVSELCPKCKILGVDYIYGFARFDPNQQQLNLEGETQ